MRLFPFATSAEPPCRGPFRSLRSLHPAMLRAHPAPPRCPHRTGFVADAASHLLRCHPPAQRSLCPPSPQGRRRRLLSPRRRWLVRRRRSWALQKWQTRCTFRRRFLKDATPQFLRPPPQIMRCSGALRVARSSPIWRARATCAAAIAWSLRRAPARCPWARPHRVLARGVPEVLRCRRRPRGACARSSITFRFRRPERFPRNLPRFRRSLGALRGR